MRLVDLLVTSWPVSLQRKPCTPLSLIEQNAYIARNYIAHLDGYSQIPGGWISGHWIQIAYQLANSVAGGTYSFVVSIIVLMIMDRLPFLKLRVSADDEVNGVDHAELGEFAVSIIAFYLVSYANQIFSTTM